MMKNLLLGVCAITIATSCVCGFVGCDDDRNYPAGFLESASQEGAAAAAATAFAGAPRVTLTPDAPTEAVAAPMEVTPEAVVETLAADLNLPVPAIVQVAAGEEPFQKLARSNKFDEFRRKSARYIQLRAELLPYGKLLADGAATTEQRATHNRIEHAAELAFKPLNSYMWDERWSEEDRAAMGWILYGSMQRPQTP